MVIPPFPVRGRGKSLDEVPLHGAPGLSVRTISTREFSSMWKICEQEMETVCCKMLARFNFQTAKSWHWVSVANPDAVSHTVFLPMRLMLVSLAGSRFWRPAPSGWAYPSN